ncbi:hypothetical protein [Novilysobacter arseniciresistens]|uniref:hypothetical protein n=1 Tax=Novilysobacter arseniciresistens TaxID=1385522 RepID=UPI001269F503|nr:hypothetical protein [Lysobacter arseniciresistens]
MKLSHTPLFPMWLVLAPVTTHASPGSRHGMMGDGMMGSSMMGSSMMGGWMMAGCMLLGVLLIIFLVLAVFALIKYLRSDRHPRP